MGDDWSVILRRPERGQVVLYNASERRVVVRADAGEHCERRTLSAPAITVDSDGDSSNGSDNSLTADKSGDAAGTNKAIALPPGDSARGDAAYFQCLAEHHRVTGDARARGNGAGGFSPIPPSAFNQGYYARFFREGPRLGRGARGTVHLAHHVLEGALLGEYAVKKVPVGDDAARLFRVLREVRVLEGVRHANVVAYRHAWLEMDRPTVFGPPVPVLFILMEYANGGTLEDYAAPQKEGASSALLPLADALFVLAGAARGLAHLHAHGVVHRDLKPANVLLHQARADARPRVLLSDFGECNALDADERTGATGTIEYCAPELLRTAGGRFVARHSRATDVWALGMLLHCALYGGALPWRADLDDIAGLRAEMLAATEVRPPRGVRADVPPALLALLSRLLSLDAAQRPTAEEALRAAEDLAQRLGEPRVFVPRPLAALPGAVPQPSAAESASAGSRLHWRSAVPYAVLALWLALTLKCYPAAVSLSNTALLGLGVASLRVPRPASAALLVLWAAYRLAADRWSLCACA